MFGSALPIHKEIEINEIDDAGKCQAREHDPITSHMDDDAHDHWSKT